MQESITKAIQTSDLLSQNLREAYQKSRGLSEILIRDVLTDIAKLDHRLKEIGSALTG